MKKTKKILVPTDFSKSAENALRFAILMGDKIDAEIVLLNIIQPDIALIEVPVTVDIAIHEKIKLTKKKFAETSERVLAQVMQQLKNVPSIQSEVEVGTPDSAIARIAKEQEFDYIFMGTRSKHDLIDKWLGTVASNVTKNAACPVMVIPEKANYRETTFVAYATDFSEADPYEIWRVSKLLAPFSPIIRCVHFFEKNEKSNVHPNMEELESFFENNVPALQITFHKVPTRSAANSLLEFLDTYDINLLVMYQPHRSFFEKLFHKSLSKKMALQSGIPVLVMKG